MAYALGLLQHNADEELWSACRDEYDEYEPAQHALTTGLRIARFTHGILATRDSACVCGHSAYLLIAKK